MEDAKAAAQKTREKLGFAFTTIFGSATIFTMFLNEDMRIKVAGAVVLLACMVAVIKNTKGIVRNMSVGFIVGSIVGVAIQVFLHMLVFISFDVGEGINTPSQQIVVLGKPYGDAFMADGLPSLSSRDDYFFDGWYLDLYDEDSRITNGTLVKVVANHTLHAKWTRLKPLSDKSLMYNQYPSVPDPSKLFGLEMTQKDAYRLSSSDVEQLDIEHLYFYGIKEESIARDAMDGYVREYIGTLEKQGFDIVENALNDGGGGHFECRNNEEAIEMTCIYGKVDADLASMILIIRIGAYYKKHPLIPDFGQIFGHELKVSGDMNDSYIYAYNNTDAGISEHLQKYSELLKSKGFSEEGSFKSDQGGVYYNQLERVRVVMIDSAEEDMGQCAVAVYENV